MLQTQLNFLWVVSAHTLSLFLYALPVNFYSHFSLAALPHQLSCGHSSL